MESLVAELQAHKNALEREEKTLWAQLNQNLGRQALCVEIITRLLAPAPVPTPEPEPHARLAVVPDQPEGNEK